MHDSRFIAADKPGTKAAARFLDDGRPLCKLCMQIQDYFMITLRVVPSE